MYIYVPYVCGSARTHAETEAMENVCGILMTLTGGKKPHARAEFRHAHGVYVRIRRV